MGRPLIRLEGQKFGMWSVLRFDGRKQAGMHRRAKWICRCDCGVERSVFASNLRARESGCGCERQKELLKRNTKHGLYGTPLYWRIESAKKLSVKLRAMPRWADAEKIKKIYKNCPPGHDVDHIVPLRGKTVSGLHWEGNLQYLPRRENQSKKNRHWPDMPGA